MKLGARMSYYIHEINTDVITYPCLSIDAGSANLRQWKRSLVMWGAKALVASHTIDIVDSDLFCLHASFE